MRILVLSDIHYRLQTLKRIVGLLHNKDLELIVILGDLTNFGGKKQAEEVLALLPKIETVAIPGNLDTGEVKQALEDKGISLHAKKKRIGKWVFAGFGGGLAGKPGEFLFTEEEIRKNLSRLLKAEKDIVLLTHLPPFGTKLDSVGENQHAGSKAVREAIEQEQPMLHLCGHIHESFGEENIGKTTSINIGAVKEGKAMLLELGKEIKWERIRL